jgi:hypothetical protein
MCIYLTIFYGQFNITTSRNDLPKELNQMVELSKLVSKPNEVAAMEELSRISNIVGIDCTTSRGSVDISVRNGLYLVELKMRFSGNMTKDFWQVIRYINSLKNNGNCLLLDLSSYEFFYIQKIYPKDNESFIFPFEDRLLKFINVSTVVDTIKLGICYHCPNRHNCTWSLRTDCPAGYFRDLIEKTDLDPVEIKYIWSRNDIECEIVKTNKIIFLILSKVDSYWY